ncbi:platelet-activating factor acetylhydrolase, isoform II-domain-containing protein [Roridomyces roridus]|uniref:1-alkyl-2-acetylglycerophosphocholine esterase n=1 Tax=Roridomyces roridus TaxID=1738132 RepID=A0AAD7C507_9AGAR|nr:platelet-activating factor acetylhydrolase, isoform II-domain-containing protein [Roridomyces roridus]
MFYLRPPLYGRFPIGAVTLSAPQAPVTIGNATLEATGKPAWLLDDVAFTVFYPCAPAPSSRRGLDWLLRPVSASLRGFSLFSNFPAWLLWPVIRLFGSLLKIPAYVNAPLLHPGDSRKQWPLVVFSHGLCGASTYYSQICSEIASSGRIVIAIQHRDGTSPACTVRPGRSDERTIFYYRTADVVFPQEEPSPHTLPIRADQLVFRRNEVYRIYHAFCAFVRGNAVLDTIDGASPDIASWAPPSSPPLVNTDNITLMGHSFGGCTVLSILSNPPPKGFSPIPIKKVLLYDPWLDPLPTPGPSPISSMSEATATDVEKPPVEQREEMLVINSQIFSLWTEHFTRLSSVVDAWEPQGRRLLTLVGCKHAQFSDFPVLPVVRTKAAVTIANRIAELTLGYLDGELEATLDKVPTRAMQVETVKVMRKRRDGRLTRRLVGDLGDVVVH